MENLDSQRLAVVEITLEHQARDINDLSVEIRELSKSVNGLTTTLAVVIDDRDKARQTLSRFKTAGLSFASTLAVALIVFLCRIAWMVQGARVIN